MLQTLLPWVSFAVKLGETWISGWDAYAHPGKTPGGEAEISRPSWSRTLKRPAHKIVVIFPEQSLQRHVKHATSQLGPVGKMCGFEWNKRQAFAKSCTRTAFARREVMLRRHSVAVGQ